MPTPPPVGRREFFALEAGEYLERLAHEAGGIGIPDANGLVRYARALRGAALMGGPPGFAVAAGAIESLGKAVREGSLPWDPRVAESLAEAIEECKALLRRVREWADADLRRAESVAGRLDALVGAAGKRASVPLTSTGEGLSAGVRAYVAREAAAVAATLEQVGAAAEHHPTLIEADPIVQRLQPLRGLGALPGLSPLPELLEALDLTLASAGRGGAWPPGAARALRITGTALARMARDIAELGIPQPDAHEVVQAAESLREAFGRSDDVVAISTLFRDGDPSPIERRGEPPLPVAATGGTAVELTGIAERLRHAAGQLAEGTSRAGRSLALNSLGLTLRGLTLSPDSAAATSPLFRRLDREIASGRALHTADLFSKALTAAASALQGAGESGSARSLAGLLGPVVAELDRVGGVTATPAEATLDEIEVLPIEALALDDERDVVPIASLLYDAAPAVAPSLTPFEQTFSTYFALLHPRDETPIVPIESLAPAPAEPEPVPIQALLYAGRRALERADFVRRELDIALRTKPSLAGVEALLSELLELVPLALVDDR
ncbi:MAG: hypothetical protein HOP28_10765 [Gemmatimonadales bacterium]|nr:hypothetical protein [Gemmatimonadales bacterium]